MTLLALPDGTDVPVTIGRSRRARRISLHVGAFDGQVRLVLPRGVAIDEGLSFARAKGAWILRRRRLVPERVEFDDGVRFPLLGRPIRIRYTPQLWRDAWLDGGELRVSCETAELGASVRGWLLELADSEIRRRVARDAAALARRPARVRIGDPKTLWGSCSPAGHLSFSWRLILAPEAVLDYVVAHEVAHLAELNHGPRFWSLVGGLCGDPAAPRRWLRDNGAELHRYDWRPPTPAAGAPSRLSR